MSGRKRRPAKRARQPDPDFPKPVREMIEAVQALPNGLATVAWHCGHDRGIRDAVEALREQGEYDAADHLEWRFPKR